MTTIAMAEGGPIFWVATHRIHHQHSDREGDPHTPRDATWWAHAGWILSGQGLHHDAAVLARYVPDLVRDPVHVALSKWHWTSNVIVGLGLLAFGGMPYVLWGIFSNDGGPARHLARELGDTQVGFAPVPDSGRFDEQLVGRTADLRRGLAWDVKEPRLGHAAERVPSAR